MTISEMKRKKGELGYSYEMLSDMSGLPVSTIQKLFCGLTKHPRRKTVEALELVFLGDQKENLKKLKVHDHHPFDERPKPLSRYACRYPDPDPDAAFLLREPVAAYGAYTGADGVKTKNGVEIKKTGNTIEDYYALPDDARVELIDGVFYDISASPTAAHQMIAGALFNMFSEYIDKKGGSCVPFTAPLDVTLDDYSLIQPDVFVICDRDKIKTRIEGAPDLVIEILSETTGKKDRFVKFPKYERSGVRECWLIDPEKKKIIVTDYTRDDDMTIYGFEDEIPVGIWDGDLKIDFRKIWEKIRFLYD